jgi:hypothetical protein
MGDTYQLTVNKKPEKWPERHITGAQIKTLAGSPADYVVNQIVPGPGGDPEIGSDQSVDLAPQSEPHGEKKFTTRKPTTTPGKSSFLPRDDREFLATKGHLFSEHEEPQANGTVRRFVVFDGFPCDGENYARTKDGELERQATCKLLVEVPIGYSTTQLDSFYTLPRLLRSDGTEPDRANGSASLLGEEWQFWSRHLSKDEWRIGVDGFDTYLNYVRSEVKRA